jgi:hypothetical protein
MGKNIPLIIYSIFWGAFASQALPVEILSAQIRRILYFFQTLNKGRLYASATIFALLFFLNNYN